MLNKYILSLDVGTTGCRAIIFNLKGEIVSQSYEEYQSIYLSPRWIDHDPSTWLKASQNTLNNVIKEADISKENIEAISVTSQRATFTPVDKDGNYLSNAMLWQDKRAIEEADYLSEKFGEEYIYKLTGLRIDPYFTLPKLLWLKKNKLNIYKSAHKFLFVQDLVINYLTGEFVTDWTQASRSMLFNIDEFKWNNDFAKEVGIDLDKLPKAVPPGSIAGKLKNDIAKELGLKSDIPVIAAGGDQQCAAVGLGVTQPGIVLANTGTGSFVLTGADNPVKDDKQRVICTASAVKGKWMLEASIFTTGSVYRWFRDNFSSVEIDAGKRLGLSPYDIMNTEVGKAPIGSNGLILIPHFAASAAPYWNPEARGILFGLELGHKRPSIIRSFLEGISFEIQKNLSIMGNLTKEVSEVRVSGGMTKSSTFNQIQADIYGKDVLKTECGESSSLGAAILAANTIDLFPDIDDAVQNMVNVNEKSHKYPKKEAHEIYKEISELHDSIYKALNNGGVYSKAEKLSNTLNKQIK